jgi:hypothetical protein
MVRATKTRPTRCSENEHSVLEDRNTFKVQPEDRRMVNKVDRTRSLMFYNIPEPDAMEPSARLKQDMEAITRIITGLLQKGDSPIEIKQLFRVGSKAPDERPKPITTDAQPPAQQGQETERLNCFNAARP